MVLLHSLKCLRIPCKLTSEISFRNFVSRVGNRVAELNNDHLFKKIWTKQELIDYLISNVYYQDDNYVVFNKPYGVLARIDRSKPVVFEGEGAACEFALSDIFSELSAQFNAKDLSLLTHPQWLFSGLTLMSKGNGSKCDILRDFKNINNKNRKYSYLAVVLGDIPATFEDSFRVSKNFELIEEKKKSLKSTVISYKHKVLGSSSGASLVKVDLNYNYLLCVRLILSTKCLSPVLGDFTYSARVTTLFEVPLLVPSGQSNVKKALPPGILKLLHLTPEEVDCCPCHVHLYSSTLRVKNHKFVASVPPPEYFVWTCERLGLKEVKQFFRGVDDFSEFREASAHDQ